METRARFRELLAALEITQAQCATLICERTKRPCAVRTVRSWLNDPDKPSARPCPAWAITLLEAELRKRQRNASER